MMQKTELKSTGINYIVHKSRMPHHEIRQSIANDQHLRILHLLFRLEELTPGNMKDLLKTDIQQLSNNLCVLRRRKLVKETTSLADKRSKLYSLNNDFKEYIKRQVEFEYEFGNEALKADLPQIN